MTNGTRPWSTVARADKWLQDEEPQKTITIIEELVAGGKPSAAAQKVYTLLEPLVKKKPDTVSIVWDILFRAARAIGDDETTSERLVDFVFALQQLDPVLNEAGKKVTLDNSNQSVVWSDLPGFTLMFREYCIYIESPIDYEGDDWLAQAPLLLNASVFGALYLSKAPDYRLTFFAALALIDGLEVSYSPAQARYLNMYLSPAAVWIRLAGPVIYKYCVEGYDKAGATCRLLEGSTWQWTGDLGFNLERWEFWKRRLGELAVEVSEEETQRLLEEALSTMESVEKTVV